MSLLGEAAAVLQNSGWDFLGADWETLLGFSTEPYSLQIGCPSPPVVLRKDKYFSWSRPGSLAFRPVQHCPSQVSLLGILATDGQAGQANMQSLLSSKTQFSRCAFGTLCEFASYALFVKLWLKQTTA